jgi:hypothetical protein
MQRSGFTPSGNQPATHDPVALDLADLARVENAALDLSAEWHWNFRQQLQPRLREPIFSRTALLTRRVLHSRDPT